jgi:proline racemase
MQPDRCHAMSGSNAISVTTMLLETGVVAMREPETVVILETAAGLVRAHARCRDGKCERVSLTMPPAFVVTLDAPVAVEGLGTVAVDIAFGGVFYALVDPAPLGLAIAPGAARDLVATGMRILAAVQAQHHPHHPSEPGLDGIAYLMWCGHDAEGLRNATVMPPGRLDRSPCGTGSSARIAALHARGEATVGNHFSFRSTIGTRFEAEFAGTTMVRDLPAVLSRLSGRGWIYSREEIGLDPTDPYPLGHLMSDIWGPGAGELP